MAKGTQPLSLLIQIGVGLLAISAAKNWWDSALTCGLGSDQYNMAAGIHNLFTFGGDKLPTGHVCPGSGTPATGGGSPATGGGSPSTGGSGPCGFKPGWRYVEKQGNTFVVVWQGSTALGGYFDEQSRAEKTYNDLVAAYGCV